MSEEPLRQRSVVAAPGRISWHVVGGVGPYTAIEQFIQNGVYHVTVIDAAGNMAHGSALLKLREEIVFKDCGRKQYEFTEDELEQIRKEEARKSLALRNSSGSGGPGRGPRTLISPESKGGGKGGSGGFRSTFGERTSSSHTKTGGSGGSGGGTRPQATYRNTLIK